MASVWQTMQDFYAWALENGDSRTDPWLLVYSPAPVILIFSVYLVLVALGPRLMGSREPFTLHYVLLIYNVALVGLSVYMFYEFLVTSVLAGYSYLCQPVDYSESELGMRMARVCWWFYFSKVIELLDTIFFIMRKKFNQISFLHVYHHATMIFNWWAGVKYVAGGQAFFIGMLNSFVHIFMYLYYALAVLGPSMQKYLWWKRYLTLLQLVNKRSRPCVHVEPNVAQDEHVVPWWLSVGDMGDLVADVGISVTDFAFLFLQTQFGAIALHSGYNLVTDCPFPDGFNTAVFAYIITLIILFLNFYYQTYLRRTQRKKM
uniref:Elongation of very long chain fatty acids protein n=1 Tax=Leptobrachium leishanense TaxID=445787 RepID=A0A8C5Q9D7_9ANUR